MKSLFLLGLTMLISFPMTALAQGATPTVMPTDQATTTVSDSALALPDDEEVEIEPQAETLPTDGIRYQWERLRLGLVRAFTLNAQKKAALYQDHLHHLDRKLAACTELGDEACVTRIQTRIDNLNERAEKFMARKEELREKHLEQFQQWRERREEKNKELQTRLQANQGKMEELRQQRQENMGEFKERFQERRLELQGKRQEFRQNNVRQLPNRPGVAPEKLNERQQNLQQSIEQQQKNRERLIELRSQRVKNGLDQTRQKVQERNQQQLGTSPVQR